MDLQLKANKLKADYVSLRYARNAIKVVNNLRSKNNKYKFCPVIRFSYLSEKMMKNLISAYIHTKTQLADFRY